MSLGSVLAARLLAAETKQVAADGASFNYKRGASTVAITVRVAILSTAVKYLWFTSTEVAAWTAAEPAYVFHYPGDFTPFTSEPTTSDYIEITNYAGSATRYDVKRWDKQKVAGVVIRTLVFVAKH